MILRCSDRALAETLARDNLRVSALWAELDDVQEQISETLAASGNTYEYRKLSDRERDLLAQLDRIDD